MQDYYKLEFRAGNETHRLLTDGFQLGAVERNQSTFSFRRLTGPTASITAFTTRFGAVASAHKNWLFLAPVADDELLPHILYSAVLQSCGVCVSADDLSVLEDVVGAYVVTRRAVT